jgi:serine/threonine protein kinase
MKPSRLANVWECVMSHQRSMYCARCERSFLDLARCPEDGAQLVSVEVGADEMLGRVLDDRYRIVERLGAGGMGTVYRASQLSVERDVAIKLVNPQMVRDPRIIRRFLREARLASQLLHPNAVAVLDFGQTADGLFYMVMELVRGKTLDAVLAEEGPMAPDRVVRIGMQICDALMGAHHLSIVHRDLKLSNVILDRGGKEETVKVLDFGVARSLLDDGASVAITQTGALLGTPAYMPPEVLDGRPGDLRADLYSLGVMLYELASGRIPYSGRSLAELVTQMATAGPVPPQVVGIPGPLAQVIARLLARDPDHRHSDALELKSDLARIDLRSMPPRAMPTVRAPAPTPHPPYTPHPHPPHPHTPHPHTPHPHTPHPAWRGEARPSRRGVLWIVAGGLAVLCLAIALALSLGAEDDTAPETPSGALER